MCERIIALRILGKILKNLFLEVKEVILEEKRQQMGQFIAIVGTHLWKKYKKRFGETLMIIKHKQLRHELTWAVQLNYDNKCRKAILLLKRFLLGNKNAEAYRIK
jgi:hypothetical protein